MADLGLLAGIGMGLQEGVKSYQTERRYQDEKAKEEAERQALKRRLLADNTSKGIRETADGYEYTPEQKRRNAIKEAGDQASLAKAGFLAEYDESSGVANLKPIPGFLDLDRKLKEAMIGNVNAKTASESAPKEPKPPTEGQLSAAGFGRRIEKAEKDFAALLAKGYNAADPKSRMDAMNPIGFLKSEEAKLQDQAERNFINAVLRRESGAAISPTEFDSAAKQYFPRAGDTPKVLAQKAANRKQVFVTLKSSAGRAWDEVPLVDNADEQPPPPPAGGKIKMNGKIYSVLPNGDLQEDMP